MQGRTESYSPWLPTNPRAVGRDGEGRISMEDAPLLAPLDVPIRFARFPQGFGDVERGFRGGKPWERRKGT